MQKHSRLVAAFGCVATLAMVGCAANSGVAPLSGVGQQSSVPAGPGWIEKDGVLYHTPHYMVTRDASRASRIQPDTSFIYFGGPVLVKPKIYLIFWGYQTYGDPDGVATLEKTYVKHMGGSSHNNIYTQYYEKVGSKTIYIKNPKKQFGGAWFDQTDSVPTNPSDAQVAAESLAGVAHFGYDANGSYVVLTPHGHSTPGFGTQFCAYHSDAYSGGKLVSYTNMPYQPDAGGSCGANIITPPSDESGVDEGMTIVEGHEEGESVTDPNPGTGWYNGQYGEIGDICAWQDIQNDPFGNDSFTEQPMWSNASDSCVQGYPSN
jgi:hypothetical protein